MAQARDIRRRSTFPKHLHDRIARNDVDQQEDHGDD